MTITTIDELDKVLREAAGGSMELDILCGTHLLKIAPRAVILTLSEFMERWATVLVGERPVIPAWTNDLGCIVRLLDPEWGFQLRRQHGRGYATVTLGNPGFFRLPEVTASASTPELALLLCAIRAYGAVIGPATGLVVHSYVNASDDPGAYDADLCDRQAVTVAWAYENLCDEALWLWHDTQGSGLDPWRFGSGMDRSTSGTCYFFEIGNSASVTLQPGDRVYAQRRDLRRLGFSAGEPGGPKMAPTQPMRV